MYIQTKNAIQNPCLFDINKICNNNGYYHNKKYYLFGIKYYFKIIFNQNQTTNTYFISTPSLFSKITNNAMNNLSIQFLETNFHGNDLRINLEDSLHHYINPFLEKRYTFSHIDEMNISTINNIHYMTHEYYIYQPIPYVQRRIIIILDKYPSPISSNLI